MTSGSPRAAKATNAPPDPESLRDSGAFEGLGEEAWAQVVDAGTVTRLRPWRQLSPHKPGSQELYQFVIEGHVGVALSMEPGPDGAAKKKKGREAAEADYLGFFVRGDCFSGSFGTTQEPTVVAGMTTTLTCIALAETVLLGLPADVVTALFERYPEFARLHYRRNGELRLHFLYQQVPGRRLVQNFFLRQGLSVARSVHVVQLDRCIDCQACQNACKARHGRSRLGDRGPRLGRLAFAQTCRDCTERICTAVCREQAIYYDEALQRTRIAEDRCNGCGACAQMCPAGAIAIPGGKGTPASKCDGCESFGDAACVAACPTGALLQLSPGEVFEEPRDRAAGDRPSFCPTAFALGLDEHQARAHVRRKVRLPWAAALGTLAMVGVGLECFLRRTMPSHSLAALTLGGAAASEPVGFVSGRGLGHELGYVGSVLMLAVCLYPLRSRLRLAAWLPKRLCLTLHIWGGLAGAAFVTYHSLLKLDRWPVLSLYATWLVVLSGAIGRYVYGWVDSQAGLAEVEEALLEQERRRLEVVEAQRGALQGAPCAKGLALWAAMPAMLWRDLSDRVGRFWMRVFGLRDLGSVGLRRQALRLMAERSHSILRKRYLETAKRLLALWNRIHWVLTLVMVAIAALHTVYAIKYSGW